MHQCRKTGTFTHAGQRKIHQPLYLLKSSSAASSTKGLSQWATGRMGTIARLNPEAMKTYEESLKTYWDNYSVLQTARNEGKE
jgi:hypothetical protein